MPFAISELQKAVKELCGHGQFARVWELLEPAMREAPENPHLLLIANYALEREGRVAAAFHVAKSYTRLYPSDPSGWMNLGRAWEQMYRVDEASSAYERALKVIKHDELKAKTLNNMAALWIQVGQFEKGGDYATRSIELRPDYPLSRANLGIAQLARREWVPGWENYAANLGRSNRSLWAYGEQWSGQPGQVVAVYGEQGIGDEISAASCIPDLIDISERVVIDCEPRLVNLYRRSFPKASVYGVEQAQREIMRHPEDAKQDAGIAVVQLAQHFRRKDEDFPGTAYLVPDMDRLTMWRALWASKGRPVIGVAWTGGVMQTGGKFRKWTLKDLLPVFRAVPDAHFVCLQYRDAQEEIGDFRDEYPDVDLMQYPFATLTHDYDDTAALVASLDMVFSMQTSVVHLAGALGIPTMCGVAMSGQWRYGESGEDIPWYKSVKLFRQDKRGQWNLNGVADHLKKRFPSRRAA